MSTAIAVFFPPPITSGTVVASFVCNTTASRTSTHSQHRPPDGCYAKRELAAALDTRFGVVVDGLGANPSRDGRHRHTGQDMTVLSPPLHHTRWADGGRAEERWPVNSLDLLPCVSWVWALCLDHRCRVTLHWVWDWHHFPVLHHFSLSSSTSTPACVWSTGSWMWGWRSHLAMTVRVLPQKGAPIGRQGGQAGTPVSCRARANGTGRHKGSGRRSPAFQRQRQHHTTDSGTWKGSRHAPEDEPLESPADGATKKSSSESDMLHRPRATRTYTHTHPLTLDLFFYVSNSVNGFPGL